jgi:hypothetical protein
MDCKAGQIDLKAAYECTDLREFLAMVFPEEWNPLIARIIESGAVFRDTDKFAPRWSTIPFTQRRGATDTENYLKSIIFRVHDALHQLWGLPTPKRLDEDEFYYFKRVWMCAEVAVLTITEFFYCQWLYETQEQLRPLLMKRNTLLFKETSPLKHKNMLQTAARLDELIHKKTVPKWVRDNRYGMIFIKDYVPMLEQDRVNIDHNWALLLAQEDKSYLNKLPNQRYSRKLDGLELTTWMIQDFNHLLDTDEEIDHELARFNQARRELVNLPDTWNNGPPVPSPQKANTG